METVAVPQPGNIAVATGRLDNEVMEKLRPSLPSPAVYIKQEVTGEERSPTPLYGGHERSPTPTHALYGGHEGSSTQLYGGGQPEQLLRHSPTMMMKIKLAAMSAMQGAGTALPRCAPAQSSAARANRRCQVCEEVASGNFFGALVCLPCKTFFIRCTTEDITTFKCRRSGDCEITGPNRSRCKYCRYMRCIEVGMVRKERPEHVEAVDGQQLCVVCRDIANGIHFGVISCEGCKKFFRRGLQEHESYVCKYNQGCVINPKTRNDCRFCRFRKCLAAGMSRDAIKMGRPRKNIKELEGCGAAAAGLSPLLPPAGPGGYLPGGGPASPPTSRYHRGGAHMYHPYHHDNAGARMALSAAVYYQMQQQQQQQQQQQRRGHPAGAPYHPQYPQGDTADRKPSPRELERAFHHMAAQHGQRTPQHSPGGYSPPGAPYSPPAGAPYHPHSPCRPHHSQTSPGNKHPGLMTSVWQQQKPEYRHDPAPTPVMTSPVDLCTTSAVPRSRVESDDSSGYDSSSPHPAATPGSPQGQLARSLHAGGHKADGSHPLSVLEEKYGASLPQQQPMDTSTPPGVTTATGRVSPCSTASLDSISSGAASPPPADPAVTSLPSKHDVFMCHRFDPAYWRAVLARKPGAGAGISPSQRSLLNTLAGAYRRFTEDFSKDEELSCLRDKWHSPSVTEQTSVFQKQVVHQLATVIHFVHQIPDFSSINCEDKYTILRLGTIQLCSVVAAVNLYNPLNNTFLKAFFEEELPATSPLREFRLALLSLARALHNLNLDSIEAACLLATLAVATDWPSLNAPDQLEALSGELLQAFHAYVNDKYGEASTARLQSVLAVVPRLRELGMWHYRITFELSFME